jgi:hypothetical protein
VRDTIDPWRAVGCLCFLASTALVIAIIALLVAVVAR